jgi:hypothetical protein
MQDDCPSTPDPGQADSDGDGIGDVCDPCNNIYNGGTFATRSKLIVTKLFSGPGDDKVKIKGYLSIPLTPPVRPDLNGIRVILQRAGGSNIFDVTLPAGAYNATNKVGWKVNGTQSKFVYKNAGNPVPLINGINKVSLGLSSKTPGLAKFQVGGKNSTYAPIANPTDIPLKATLIIDVPNATTGQCGETNYLAGNCLFVSGGNTVKCQK